MAFTATPIIVVDFDTVPHSTGTLVAVDELRVQWGRAGLLERITPATAQLTVRDTGRGSPFASRRDLIGRRVTVTWQGTDASSGTLFRGRITDAAIAPRRRGGHEVTLSCSSLEVDAGNHRVPGGTTWPAESIATRRNRISALAPAELYAPTLTPTRAAVGLTNVADPARDFDAYTAAPADVGGRNMLELLHELFDSVYPTPLVYDPHRNGFGYVARRRYTYRPTSGNTYTARLLPAPERGGKYVTAPAEGAPAVTFEAPALAYEGKLTYPLESRITRVEVGYTTTAKVTGTAVASIDGGAGESIIGRRTLSIASVLAEPDIAAQLANSWADAARVEAASPRLDALRFDTARTPWPSAVHAAALLRGCESSAQFFVNGAWSAAVGARPLYGILGQTITYAAGQWSIELVPAPVGVEYAVTAPTALTPRGAGNALLRDVDSSVTLADLNFTDVGTGYTADTQPLNV